MRSKLSRFANLCSSRSLTLSQISALWEYFCRTSSLPSWTKTTVCGVLTISEVPPVVNPHLKLTDSHPVKTHSAVERICKMSLRRSLRALARRLLGALPLGSEIRIHIQISDPCSSQILVTHSSMVTLTERISKLSSGR